MTDDTTIYECIDCPSYGDVEPGQRLFELPDVPLFCPYCGHQTLTEWGVDRD